MKKSPFAVTALFALVLSLGGCVWGPGYHDHGGYDHGGYEHSGGGGWHNGPGGPGNGWH